jgi:hypothetical protein
MFLRQCMSPLVAQAGHAAAVRRGLLLGVERTCRSSGRTSECDPERTQGELSRIGPIR